MMSLMTRNRRFRIDNLVGIMKGRSIVEKNLNLKSFWPHLKSKRGIKTSTFDWKPITTSKGNLATIDYHLKIPNIRRFFLSLMILMPVISFFLGCWQVKRLHWKNELISKCENNLAFEPMATIPDVLDPAVIPDFEYRRFKVKGHFDYSQEIFLGPRIKNGNVGYLVITPFIRKNGKPILIERGWIAKEKIVPSTRDTGYLSHLAFPQGEIEIEALFRSMPLKSVLQFDHEPGSRLFTVHDIPVMAEQTGALPIYCQMIFDLTDKPEWRPQNSDSSSWKFWKKSDKQVVEEEDLKFIKSHSNDETLQYQEFEFIEQGVPVAQLPKLKFSNNHLQYLITWFGLAFCSAGLLIYSIVKKGKYSSAEKIISAKRQNLDQNFRER